VSLRPLLAVSMGDPVGIGPEVIVKALDDPTLRTSAAWRVLGPRSAWLAAGGGSDIEVLERSPISGSPYSGSRTAWTRAPSIEGGETSYQCVADAIALAKLPHEDPRHVGAIVTGPISKEAWSLAGHSEFPGHTEMLAAGFNIADGDFGMFFHAPAVTHSRSHEVTTSSRSTPHAAPSTPSLNVMLATVHVPLAKVPGMLTIGRVVSAIRLGHRACVDLGLTSPRVAVCGLNPHAGERGLLGSEDDAVISPAIKAAQELGIDASGPHPGDTVFNAAVRGKYDLVVAMYHDQGLIPLKLLAFDRAVNVTVGLQWKDRKVVRTSPDHGTAFDIAGKNAADAGSMKAAMQLAVHMSR